MSNENLWALLLLIGFFIGSYSAYKIGYINGFNEAMRKRAICWLKKKNGEHEAGEI